MKYLFFKFKLITLKLCVCRHQSVTIIVFCKVLPTLVSQSARKVAALVQEGKGKFLLKISLDPFTENDVKVAVVQNAVRVTGSRGENTGMSNWSHHLHMEFPLPSNIKQDTIATKFENKTVVIVSADTAA